MEIRLDGRRALITGGSLGIGYAIAREFAASGGRVTIVGRRPEVLAQAAAGIREATGTDVATVAADVSTAAGCERAVAEASAAMGGVDILVNNAGSSQRAPFLETDDAAWQADLDLKLFAAIRLMRLVLPAMAERRWGRVINVLNTGAKAPPTTSAPTSVSRAAGMALTKAVASEYAAHNVLVNALLVGRIKSDQWERRQRASGERSLDEYYAAMGSALPIGRVGEAAEFAAVACLLASDAGGYVAGTAINIDGGLCPVV